MSKKIEKIINKFIEDNKISCAETIYQTDRVLDNALELIEILCDEVGYYEYGDDE